MGLWSCPRWGRGWRVELEWLEGAEGNGVGSACCLLLGVGIDAVFAEPALERSARVSCRASRDLQLTPRTA